MHGTGNKICDMTVRAYILLFCLLPALALGQYDSEGDEISRFRPGTMWFFTGFRPAKVDKPRKYDRLIFDLHYNDWIGDLKPLKNSWASIGFNSNLMFDIPLSRKNTVALGIGIAHQLMRIQHEGRFVYDSISGASSYQVKDSLDQFKRSIFGGHSLSIPIELRFRNASWRHFKFHLGGRIGYQFNVYNKFVFQTDEGREVHKQYGLKDSARLVYSAHIRMGLRNWALYGSYSFNSLFTNAASSKLNLVQVGLSISLF